MPTVKLSSATSAKLQRLAIPLVDDFDSLIGRLADAALEGKVFARPGEKSVDELPRRNGILLPDVHPIAAEGRVDLTHTRILKATFGGKTVQNPNWNHLARYAHEVGLSQLKTIESLRAASGANVRSGKYLDDGFKYITKGNFSLQNKSANLCWESILRLAKALGLGVEVTVEWSTNPDAAHPGKVSTLSWKP